MLSPLALHNLLLFNFAFAGYWLLSNILYAVCHLWKSCRQKWYSSLGLREGLFFDKPRILHSSDFVVKLILQIDLQMRPIKAVFAFEENHVIFTFPSMVLFYVALKHCHYSNYLQVFNSVIAASSFFFVAKMPLPRLFCRSLFLRSFSKSKRMVVIEKERLKKCILLRFY